MTLRNVFVCAVAPVLMLTFAGCQTAPTPEPKRDVAADTTALKALEAQFIAAVNSRDAPAAAATYTDDAIGMFPNAAAAEGKQAIQAAFEAFFKYNTDNGIVVTMTATPLETQVAGDWAYQRSNVTFTSTPKTGKPIEESGKYLSIAKRQPDGSWKIHRAINNGDAPPPSATGKKK